MSRASGPDVVLAAVIAFAVALALQPLVIEWLHRRQMFDVPVERSNHIDPTPRGGGIAVMVGLAAGVVASSDPLALSLLGGIVGAAAVGGAEDVRGVAVAPRLVCTSVAAVALMAAVSQVEAPQGMKALVLVLAIPWTLAVVNAVNFMDGINGISATTGLVGGAWYAFMGHEAGVTSLTLLGASTAAAALAFAPYNVPRARVFLGDVGSYGLGAAFAAMSLLAVVAGLPIEAAAAPLLPYLADTGMTILVRVRDGETWHQPHKRHTYQRLVGQGRSHVFVSVGIGIVTLLCCVLSAVSIAGDAGGRTMAGAGLVALLTAYLVSPVLLARRLPTPATRHRGVS